MTDVLEVAETGLLTTIQDLGRPQAIAAGVPPGGAMDRFAHSAANLLVGNEVGAATLECTLTGPLLIARRSCLLAITGADLDPRVNGEPAAQWKGLFLSPGDRLSFGQRKQGARAYIAVAGGFAGDRWLGSLSTSLLAARGGMHGRILLRGDVVATAGEQSAPVVSGRELEPGLRPDYAGAVLHAMLGPHSKRLGTDGRRRLFDSQFTVSRDADRTGYRLDGPLLDASGDELLSFGLTAGAIQVPGGGQPILLMADHMTAGGYPVVATVVSAALPIAAQLAPGAPLRFSEVTLDEAIALRRTQGAALATLRR